MTEANLSVGLAPFPVIVTTRIYTFLVGDPCTPSFPLLLGTGQPNLYLWKRSFHKDLLLQDVFNLMSAMIVRRIYVMPRHRLKWRHLHCWSCFRCSSQLPFDYTSKVWRFLTFSQRLWRTWPFYILCFWRVESRNWLEHHNNPAVAGPFNLQTPLSTQTVWGERARFRIFEYGCWTKNRGVFTPQNGWWK